MHTWSLGRACYIGLLVAPVLTPRPAGAQEHAEAQWGAIRQVFSAQGKMEEEYLRFDFPRKDLSVTIGGHRLAPEFELTSYMGFVPTGQGRVLAMGEVILTGAEAGPALAEARRQNVGVPALHNHLLRETPRLMYMHLMVEGQPKAVAEKLERVLAHTGAGGKAAESEQERGADKGSGGGWASVAAQLGKPEESKDSVAEWEFARKERLTAHGTSIESSGAIESGSEVVFQRLAGGQAATGGEFFLLPQEIDAVSRALTEGGIQVTAIHNHMVTEMPRMYWLHWYGTGDPASLARTIREALSHTNQRLPGTSGR